MLPYYVKVHYKNSLLHAAIRKGPVDIVIQLLEIGADTEQNGCCHKTPIIAAIEIDDIDILTLLLKLVLMFIIMYALNCSNKNQRLMLEILLKCGVDPILPDHFEYTVMHRAVQKYRCIERSTISGCIANDIR